MQKIQKMCNLEKWIAAILLKGGGGKEPYKNTESEALCQYDWGVYVQWLRPIKIREEKSYEIYVVYFQRKKEK